MYFPGHLEENDPKEICFSSADTLLMFLALLLSVTKDKAMKFGSQIWVSLPFRSQRLQQESEQSRNKQHSQNREQMCWVLEVNEIQLAATDIGQTQAAGFQHSNTVFALNGFTAIIETQYAIKTYLLHPLETCEADEEHIHSANLSYSVCIAIWAGRDTDGKIALKKTALPLGNVHSIILKCQLTQSLEQDPK